MKIVFDNIIYSLQVSGGISVVWNNLIKDVSNKDLDVKFIEYDNCDRNICRSKLDLPSILVDKRSSRGIGLNRYFNPIVKDTDKFIFHSSYFRTCSKENAINITTVHDFTYDYYEKNILKKTVHCRQKYAALRNSDYIVCISENTKKDLLHFLPELKDKDIRVIYNGVDDVFTPKCDAHNDGYVLFVGRRDNYKNFDKIIRPLERLNLPLVVVGSNLNRNETGNLSNVICKSNISDEELNELYNNALCLIYPSAYEGFGLPVLEAQRAGCPVIAMNSSSIPEIIGDTPLLLENTTCEEIVKKIRLLEDEDVRQQVIKDGLVNAKRFSWKKMQSEYIKLYEEAWSKSNM